MTAQRPLVDPLNGEKRGVPLLGLVDLVSPSSEGPVLANFESAARCSDSLEIGDQMPLSDNAGLFSLQRLDFASRSVNVLNDPLPISEVPRVACHRGPFVAAVSCWSEPRA